MSRAIEELYDMAVAHLVFEESSPEIDEGQACRLAELLAQVQGKTIERLRQAAFKIPRPWMDGGISFDEWLSALDEFKP